MELQKLAEEKVAFLIIFILLVVSVGLLIEVVPLFGSKSVTEPAPGLKPYNALELAGRDLYIREGCYNCHSQMIRPFRAETERYGHYSVGGESVYDHPFQWGSKRTGPDLARVGGRYSDSWHELHMDNPRSVVPESIMPSFPWLKRNKVNIDATVRHMKTLKVVGVPYTDEDFAAAKELMTNEDGTPKTELDAMIAYLQSLGHALADATNQAN
ncbi:MAG: cytochrome-c oxidase, cbb3-type subunit II [Neisseriaceae bacterium]|nr:cytochrome-c oxidase, cbb3-type subunit II [Neisseriaceae bacterium]MBO7554831.1 cytochrome-c oxidase, cbb3-type subunit II [Neisseriaceae bacterium]MBP5789498.1 cytochrome-c oxidase, cbb3-type subunit II [Neisseriaceae bacterium]